jgi:hypothetical protein
MLNRKDEVHHFEHIGCRGCPYLQVKSILAVRQNAATLVINICLVGNSA